jgi:drug/metabolite transporter (DMT)-like permease
MKWRTDQIKGVVLTILATLCWGGGMVLSKHSLNGLDENKLFVVQLIAAWACILVVTTFARKLSFREWRYGWLGILEPGIAFYLVLVGLGSTSAINATILQALEGLMIIGLTRILFRTRVSSRTLMWGALSTIGAIFVTTKESVLNGISINWGDDLVLLGTFFAAVYVTLSSRIVGEKNSAESLLFWQLSCCTVLLIGYQSLRGQLSLHASQFDAYSVSSGALTYGLSFYFYLWGMKYIHPNLSAMLLCLTPIFGVALSVLFLSEAINFQNVAGIAMIIVSSVFAARGLPPPPTVAATIKAVADEGRRP